MGASMERVDLWNRFSREIYGSFIDNHSRSFSDVQKDAVIAWAYDAEVNSGGHITFFDCFGDVFSINEVAAALRTVGGEAFAENFLSAAAHIHVPDTEEYGYMDDDEDAESDPAEDDIYYGMVPPLPDLLERYIFDNRESIFG